MSWHDRRLAAFDLETTGIDSESDRIVTAAVSLVGDGQPSVFHAWLLDPGIPIPPGASAVHGITTERARAEGRPPLEAVAEIVALLAQQLQEGIPIVAFNARFDLTCLDREARRHGIAPLLERVGGADGMLVIDPYVLDKQVDRFRKGKRTLGAVCAHYNVPLDDAHDSHADALAAARVAWRLGQAFDELRVDLPTLHQQQIAWAAEQAASFEDWLRRNGRDERIEAAWPIVPLPTAPDAPLPLAA
jgi:DNA polymerase III subunit epsilon